MKLNQNNSAFLIALALTCGLALALISVSAGAETAQFDHNHSAWNSLLTQYVKRGHVNYSAWRSGGRSELGQYLSTLQGVTKAQFSGWNRNQKLAFWINAYNASTVSVVLENMPTDSIMKIGGGNGLVFKRKIVPLGHLVGSGSKLSLNDVENRVIRPGFNEPRIHFALVCAAKSCPILRSEAYRAISLNRQLESQTQSFIQNSKANRYDAPSNTLYLSRIFEWYAEDFQSGSSTVATFVGRYLDGAASAAIKAKTPQIAYLEYDWTLNGR